MERIVCNVNVVGERPLLCNKMTTDELKVTKKKGSVYVPQEEAEKRLYFDDKENISLPAEHFEGCLVKAAVDFKFQGKKTYKEVFKAGVIVDPIMVPIIDPKWVIDSRSVVIQRSRIVRHRPRFDEWSLDFQLLITDDRIQPAIVEEILVSAGKYVGVADYRPKYGLFSVTKFEVL